MKFRASPLQRIVSTSLCGAAAFLCAATSDGADRGKKAVANQCESTWRDAQARSDAGHLRQARDLFLECAKPSCGPVHVKQCMARLTQLQSDIPTIVPLATDDAGAPMVDVQVKADGEVMTLKLDGRALPMDPGMHELSFSTWAHGVFATEKVLIVEGQRNRAIAVSLREPDPPPPPQKVAVEPTAAVRPAPDVAPVAPSAASQDAIAAALPKRGGRGALPYLLGGVGLASLGAGALMTYWGNKDNTALSSCSPHCAEADVTHIHSLYLASDVTFAAGAAALGLAGVLLLTGHSSSDSAPTAHAAYGFLVQPTPSGAFASVKAAF